jgi:opacity protein-like surface antigen
MRARSLLGLTAAAALMAPAAWADSVHFGLSHSFGETEVGPTEFEADATTLSAAGAFDLRGRLSMQIDGEVSTFDTPLSGDDTGGGGTLHLVARERGWMYGGFVGGYTTDIFDLVAGGGEGALYFDRFTLAGALAYAEADDINTDGVIANVEGRYFISRNFRVDARLGYASLDVAGVDMDSFIAGAGAEYRLSDTPLSLFAGVTHRNIDDIDATTNALTLGMRWNFDPDLAYRDENGASLLTVPSLASFF